MPSADMQDLSQRVRMVCMMYWQWVAATLQLRLQMPVATVLLLLHSTWCHHWHRRCLFGTQPTCRLSTSQICQLKINIQM
jgi:hypothetical protein